MPYKNKEDSAACYRRWRSRNIEVDRNKSKEYSKSVKLEVLAHYDSRCACCGETQELFLSIDHINGGGGKHLKKINFHIYRWLKKHNYPEGFQVLCHNCNRGKYFNGGICPHVTKGLKLNMSKFTPNPLGLLAGEIVWNGVAEKDASMAGIDVDSAPSFRAQVPVKEGLAAQDTFKMDASTPSSRAPVELRRMHLAGGEDVGEGSKVLEGANMYQEFGGGTGKSAGEFTENKNK